MKIYLLLLLTAFSNSQLAKADAESNADEQSRNERFSYNEDESLEAQSRRESRDGSPTVLGERNIAARKRLLQPRAIEENKDHLMGCTVNTDSSGVRTYNCPEDDEETDQD